MTGGDNSQFYLTSNIACEKNVGNRDTHLIDTLQLIKIRQFWIGIISFSDLVGISQHWLVGWL